jgi:hypothetical protein
VSDDATAAPPSAVEERRRALIAQAFDAYERIEPAVVAAFGASGHVSDETAIAFAFWDAVTAFAEGRSTRPQQARCAWCVRAAGNTDEAWRAATSMTSDEAAAHAQVCPHSPMVQEVERLRREVDSWRGSDLERQLSEARAEVERLRPVYEAAIALRDDDECEAMAGRGIATATRAAYERLSALYNAVDAATKETP